MDAVLAVHEEQLYLKLEGNFYAYGSVRFGILTDKDEYVSLGDIQLKNYQKNFMSFPSERGDPIGMWKEREKKILIGLNKNDKGQLPWPEHFDDKKSYLDFARKNKFTVWDDDESEDLVAPIFADAYDPEYDVSRVKDVEMFQNVLDVGEFVPPPEVDFEWTLTPGPSVWGKVEYLWHMLPVQMRTDQILSKMKPALEELKVFSSVFWNHGELKAYSRNADPIAVKGKLLKAENLWELRKKVEAYRFETWELFKTYERNIPCPLCKQTGFVVEGQDDLTARREDHYKYALQDIRRNTRGKASGIAERALRRASQMKIGETK